MMNFKVVIESIDEFQQNLKEYSNVFTLCTDQFQCPNEF